MDWKSGIKGGPLSPEQSKQFVEFLSGLNPGQVQWISGYLAGAGIALQSSSVNAIKKTDLPKVNNAPEPLYILYGTETGNSEKLANFMGDKAREAGLDATVKNMAVFKARDFKKVKNLAVIVSTHGMGEAPVQAAELHSILHSKKAPEMKGIKYSVLALGDTSYAQFCQAGKEFDQILRKLGAECICQRVDCDVDYEDDAVTWINNVLNKIKEDSSTGIFVKESESGNDKSFVRSTYNRRNPYKATLLEKINLNGKGSTKETIHLELSLEGSGITYHPGDALGIYAPNSHILVNQLLEIAGLSGTEEVVTYRGTKKLKEALKYDYELTPLTSVTLSRYVELSGSNRLKKIFDDNLKVIEYLHGRDIIDLLKEFPLQLSAEKLISVLRKNTARMYSIASSQAAVEDEVHLLVSVVRYQSYGRCREGLCSSYLSDRLNVDEQAQVFVEENNKFRMPEDEQTPLIMIGPGTGIAPFRAFMQQREVSDTRGKSWLFFGDRNFTTDFLYQTEWQQYLKDGLLTKADVAFSRDYRNKIYVQDKMLENGKELYDWLENGAHFYVCGDAQKMAKDVNKTLKEIVRVHGNKTNEQAEEYIKYLQVTDRYQSDVY